MNAPARGGQEKVVISKHMFGMIEPVGVNVYWGTKHATHPWCGISICAVANVRESLTFVTVQARFGIRKNADVRVGKRSAVKDTTGIQRHAGALVIKIGALIKGIFLR